MSEFEEFWTERHLCTLTTIRRDGSPHTVPVGVTFDPQSRTARIITSGGSQKVRNVEATGRISVCQVDGRRWSTLEGTAVIAREPEAVRDAEERYARRYRVPRPNPERVVIVITVTRILGTCR